MTTKFSLDQQFCQNTDTPSSAIMSNYTPNRHFALYQAINTQRSSILQINPFFMLLHHSLIFTIISLMKIKTEKDLCFFLHTAPRFPT